MYHPIYSVFQFLSSSVLEFQITICIISWSLNYHVLSLSFLLDIFSIVSIKQKRDFMFTLYHSTNFNQYDSYSSPVSWEVGSGNDYWTSPAWTFWLKLYFMYFYHNDICIFINIIKLLYAFKIWALKWGNIEMGWKKNLYP